MDAENPVKNLYSMKVATVIVEQNLSKFSRPDTVTRPKNDL